eukprot:TRINITY_DN12506_c0_g1_i1.p1 TRINITY_DN12506_c0_g1~~TRINITY_DN12506_c0_g1_i1.p1  ORF type:complete len:566 (+),score=94.68 TRINITY_DN12506_c0_g1_i1:50-1699(+)
MPRKGQRSSAARPVAAPPRSSPIAPERWEVPVAKPVARPAGRGNRIPQAPRFPDAFVKKDYDVAEMKARRRDVPSTLVRVVGCGVSELPEAGEYSQNRNAASEESAPAASGAPLRSATDGEVDVRVLLLVKIGGIDHSFIAEGAGCVLYGGPVVDGTDDEVLAATREMIALQTGLDPGSAVWAKLCTMEYNDRPKSVYVIAHITAGAVVKPSARCREQAYVEDMMKKELEKEAALEAEFEAESIGAARRRAAETQEEVKAEECGGEPVLREVTEVAHQTAPEERTQHVGEIRLRHPVPLEPRHAAFCAEAHLALDVLGHVVLRQATLDILSCLRRKRFQEPKVITIMNAQHYVVAAYKRAAEKCKAAVYTKYHEVLAERRREWANDDVGEMKDDILAKEPEREAVHNAIRAGARAEYRATIAPAVAKWNKTLRTQSLIRDMRAFRAFQLLTMQPEFAAYTVLLDAVKATYPDKTAKQCESLLEKVIKRPSNGVLSIYPLFSLRYLAWHVPRDDGRCPYALDAYTAAGPTEEDLHVPMISQGVTIVSRSC